MSDLPLPVAARLPRARWLDTRLLLGVVLVLTSVVVGAKVVAEADDTVAVWGVTRDLGAGVLLGAEDIVRRDVRLDGDIARYVSAGDAPPVGYVLVRPVGHSELLPADAVAPQATAELRRLAVEVDRISMTGLAADAVVDVYVVPETAPGADAASAQSRMVLEGVTVDEVEDRAGSLGGATRAGGVVLLVSPPEARQVMDAQMRGSLRLLQVPVSASSPGN